MNLEYYNIETYSGYLSINNTGRFIHYMFVKSESNPE